MCTDVLPHCQSEPGSCSWQCPALGSTEQVFLLQAVCCSSSWLQKCGDELHRGSFPMVFQPGEVLSPPGPLGLAHFHLSHVPSVGCFGFSTMVHLKISSSFHVNCCTFPHCCPCLEQQCFPQTRTILSLISLKW